MHCVRKIDELYFCDGPLSLAIDILSCAVESEGRVSAGQFDCDINIVTDMCGRLQNVGLLQKRYDHVWEINATIWPELNAVQPSHNIETKLLSAIATTVAPQAAKTLYSAMVMSKKREQFALETNTKTMDGGYETKIGDVGMVGIQLAVLEDEDDVTFWSWLHER